MLTGPVVSLGTYQIFSLPKRQSLQEHPLRYGGKVILPPSLKKIVERTSLRFVQLSSLYQTKFLFCTILGYTAAENTVVAGELILKQFQAEEGEPIELYLTSLPPLHYIVLEVSFYFEPSEIPNREVIEESLVHFDCLVKDQYIHILYNHLFHVFKVKRTEPENFGCLINPDYIFDMVVSPLSRYTAYLPFSGKGYTLSGKVSERIPMVYNPRWEYAAQRAIQEIRYGPFTAFSGMGYKLNDTGKATNSKDRMRPGFFSRAFRKFFYADHPNIENGSAFSFSKSLSVTLILAAGVFLLYKTCIYNPK